jgi:hypothetical protein
VSRAVIDLIPPGAKLRIHDNSHYREYQHEGGTGLGSPDSGERAASRAIWWARPRIRVLC